MQLAEKGFANTADLVARRRLAYNKSFELEAAQRRISNTITK
jgi:hypothetical protein